MGIREIIIIVGLVISLLLFGVIATLDQAIDPTDNTNETIAERGVSTEDAITRHLVEALATMDENGTSTVNLDSYDMNELLYSFKSKLDMGSIKARSIYIESGDFGYRICLPMQIYSFQTMVSGYIRMSAEGDDICLYLSGMKMGDLSIDSGFASMLGVKGAIISALRGQDIEAHFEGRDLFIRLTRENIGSFVDAHFKEDPSRSLINAIYSVVMVNSDSVKFDIHSPEDIDLTIDLSAFGGRASDKYSGLNGFSEDLLRRGVIDEGKLALVSKYYVNGYQRLTAEEQTELSALLSAEPFGAELDSYTGLVEREKLSLLSLLLSQFELSDELFSPGFKITDGNINSMLSDLSAAGTVIQYVNPADSSCVYVVVDRLYCSIADDQIGILIDVDVNGYLLTISAYFTTGESPITAANGSLDRVLLGDYRLSESETDGLFGFLADQLGQDWIFADKEKRTLTLDFTSTFKENQLLYALLSGSKNTTTVCKSSQTHEGGFVQIKFRLF